MAASLKHEYEHPEIVTVGLVIELTNGMGGDSHDMGGMTIPVQPRASASPVSDPGAEPKDSVR